MWIKPEICSSQFTDLVYANNTAFFIRSTSDASFSESLSWLKTKLHNLGTGHQLPSVTMFKGNWWITLCIWWIQSSSYKMTYRPCIFNHIFSSKNLDWQMLIITINKVTHVLNTSLISPLICIGDMDSACHWNQEFWILSDKVPKKYSRSHIHNTETTEHTGLPLVMNLIVRKCHSIFVHVARLQDDISAYQALQCQIDISLAIHKNVLQVSREANQICSDNNLPHADL